jgi:5-formyltetrahydrofolate cyclo-ligase
VIVQKSAPLEFWVWKPGMPMDRGVWDIPVPATREAVEPDVLIAPLVGFDTAGFRLGYGGGYFDRTLAASSPRPYCIGIGYSETQLQTIHPQPHDIRMDAIVTERKIVTHSPLQRPYRSPACLADRFTK